MIRIEAASSSATADILRENHSQKGLMSGVTRCWLFWDMLWNSSRGDDLGCDVHGSGFLCQALTQRRTYSLAVIIFRLYGQMVLILQPFQPLTASGCRRDLGLKNRAIYPLLLYVDSVFESTGCMPMNLILLMGD